MSALHSPVQGLLRQAYYDFLLRPVPSRIFGSAMICARCGYWPDLEQPRTFNERLLRYNLDSAGNASMAAAADKFRLRDLVRERVGERHLTRLLARWDDIASASCRGLQPPYVVKASHGCGFNHFVTGAAPDDRQLRRLLGSWSRIDYFWRRRESVYRRMTPSYFAEEFLGSDGVPPDDYKAFVFGGHVELFQVDVGRFTDHRRLLLDRDWNSMNVEYRYRPPLHAPAKPRALSEMIEVAERLGRDFEFVRVDMYALPARLIVGEMTFFPESGSGRFGSRQQDLRIGAYWPRGR